MSKESIFAEELARLLNTANQLTAREASPEEEQQEVFAFHTWLNANGFASGSLGRELDDVGILRWKVRIDTGRGTLEYDLDSVFAWSEAVQHLAA